MSAEEHRQLNDEYFGDPRLDQQPDMLPVAVLACDRGCGLQGTVRHDDGRLLCRRCYTAETSTPPPSGSP